METRKIFIDTQAFMQQGFKFEGSVLNRIRELGRSNLIEVYVSEVVKREVSSKISEKTNKAKKLSSDLIKELSVLESETPKEVIDFVGLVERNDLQEIALSRWKKFLEDSRAVILDPNEICNIELLSLYFDGKYPFSVSVHSKPSLPHQANGDLNGFPANFSFQTLGVRSITSFDG